MSLKRKGIAEIIFALMMFNFLISIAIFRDHARINDSVYEYLTRTNDSLHREMESPNFDYGTDVVYGDIDGEEVFVDNSDTLEFTASTNVISSALKPANSLTIVSGDNQIEITPKEFIVNGKHRATDSELYYGMLRLIQSGCAQ